MPSLAPRALATLAVAAAVLVAGCGGFVDVSTSAREDPDPTGAATPDTAVPTDATASVETDERTAASRSSPWGDTVVVAVEGDRTRDYAALVRRAAAYWEDNDDRYVGYGVDYEVRPDAADPDVAIRFVDSIPACDGRADAVGCAPLITDARQIDRPETVYVRAGLSDESTVRVVEHELGHTLGLTHDDPPREVMRASSVLYTTAQPNATERAFPWDDAAFTVRVDAPASADADGVREQVRRALDYYRNDPPGMPTNLTFSSVEEGDAEILVRFGDCGPRAASCVQTAGADPDGDGAIETYSRLVVTLDDVDTDAVGWHVGYWLAHGFGAEADADKPRPFRDASFRERRGEWWR